MYLFELVFCSFWIYTPEWNCQVMWLPWVGKISWRREWLPIPVFLPGEAHGQGSLAGYSPWGRKESDTTGRLTFPFHGHSSFSFLRALGATAACPQQLTPRSSTHRHLSLVSVLMAVLTCVRRHVLLFWSPSP